MAGITAVGGVGIAPGPPVVPQGPPESRPDPVGDSGNASSAAVRLIASALSSATESGQHLDVSA